MTPTKHELMIRRARFVDAAVLIAFSSLGAIALVLAVIMIVNQASK